MITNKKHQIKDSRMARVIRICHALPEGRHEIHAKHATLLVRDKVFGYYLNDHHGDGIIGVACKVLPGDNEALIAAHPEKYYMPAYVGPRGWVGLRLDIAGVNWNEVAELLVGSYKLNAANRLAVVAKLELALAAARPPRTAAPLPPPSAPAAKKKGRPSRGVAREETPSHSDRAFPKSTGRPPRTAAPATPLSAGAPAPSKSTVRPPRTAEPQTPPVASEQPVQAETRPPRPSSGVVDTRSIAFLEQIPPPRSASPAGQRNRPPRKSTPPAAKRAPRKPRAEE